MAVEFHTAKDNHSAIDAQQKHFEEQGLRFVGIEPRENRSAALKSEGMVLLRFES